MPCVLPRCILHVGVCLREDGDRVGLGTLRLVCKDWRAAVDAMDGGLKRWTLNTRLSRQPPPLPGAVVRVEALDLRTLFARGWIGQSFPRQSFQSMRALQWRLPAAFPSLRSLTLQMFNMNGCVQATVCSWVSAGICLPLVSGFCKLHQPRRG